MDKNEIYEQVIREMTEQALRERRKDCDEEEQQLYHEISQLSKQRQEILMKLSQEERQVLENYHDTNIMIADRECKYLYVQGAMDCVEMLKKLGVL